MPIRRHILSSILGGLLILFIVGGPLPVYSQTTTDASVLQIRIRNVERLLQNLESLRPPGVETSAAPQTAMMRGLLQGTDWIDPTRSVVAELTVDTQGASWLVLVPFQHPNDAFQNAYSAVAGDDYYILRFPPASAIPLDERRRRDLLQASLAPIATNLVVELAASRLLRQNEAQIEAAIQGFATPTTGGEGDAGLSPGDMQQLARDAVAAFKQVETLRLGLEMDAEGAMVLMDVKAVPDSFLAGLLIDQKTDVRLGSYRTDDYPMRFRTRSYNVAGALQMLDASFGTFYRQMGFGLEEMTVLAKGLTGEMAGGMALDQNVMTFEMIYALHDSVPGEDYLTQVYLPWFQRYNQQMASLIATQTGQPATPLYERLPDTTVAGQRVFGVKTRFPAMTPFGSQVSATPDLRDYETRFAAVDHLILIGSSVSAIEALLAEVDSFQKKPAQGPLAEFSLDLGAYLKGLQGLMDQAGQAMTIPDDIGALTMTAALQAGELTTRTRIKVQDMQGTIGLLAALSTASDSAGPALAAKTEPIGTPPPVARVNTPPVPPIERPKTAAYWMDRGGLLSAYGNYTAAVRCYREALALNSDLAEAYFQMGVAYGEMGQFEAALDAISRAIDRQPTNGAYFYGRGRIYLRAGETDLAMKDLMEAGFLGNEDARVYLEEAGVDLN